MLALHIHVAFPSCSQQSLCTALFASERQDLLFSHVDSTHIGFLELWICCQRSFVCAVIMLQSSALQTEEGHKYINPTDWRLDTQISLLIVSTALHDAEESYQHWHHGFDVFLKQSWPETFFACSIVQEEKKWRSIPPDAAWQHHQDLSVEAKPQGFWTLRQAHWDTSRLLMPFGRITNR